MKRLLIGVMLVLFAVGICSAETLTIMNCTPGTLVDGVMWTDHSKSDYVDVDLMTEREIKSFDVEIGLYALTHYRPREIIQVGDKYLVIPAAILDYDADVDVRKNEHATVEFGCD